MKNLIEFMIRLIFRIKVQVEIMDEQHNTRHIVCHSNNSSSGYSELVR